VGRTFNVADIAIAVGVIALLLDLFFNKNSLLATKKEKAKPAAA
jgi:lipoprotein signal peptidase